MTRVAADIDDARCDRHMSIDDRHAVISYKSGPTQSLNRSNLHTLGIPRDCPGERSGRVENT